MDVFIFKKPYQIFAALQDSAVDLVISSHQVIAFDLVFLSTLHLSLLYLFFLALLFHFFCYVQYSPLEPNIGIFASRGSPTTVQVFENTIQWTTRDKNVHDQRAFCLVTRLCVNRNHKQSPIDVDLPAGMKLGALLLNAHDIAASVTPRPVAGETFAAHVLSTTPLQSPVAKSYLSREIRVNPPTPRWFATGGLNTTGVAAWGGADGGYGTCPGRTRILAVEGMLSLSRANGYHCTDCLRWSLSWLVAAALVSNRTLILPPLIFDFDFQYAAMYVELSGLSKLIPWRETSFLNDPRFIHQLEKCTECDGSTASSTYDNPWPFASVGRIKMSTTKSNTATGEVKIRYTERSAARNVQRVESFINVACGSSQWTNLEDVFMASLSDSSLDLNLSGMSRSDKSNPLATAEAVFVSLPALFSTLSKPGILSPKNSLVREVYSTLRFCVKGIERGNSKGFIGDTKCVD
jgi:hypothetical protein